MQLPNMVQPPFIFFLCFMINYLYLDMMNVLMYNYSVPCEW